MDALYWTPFQRTLALLEQHVITTGQAERAGAGPDELPSDLKKELVQQAKWLLEGPYARFKPAENTSLSVLTAGRPLIVSGKKFGVQPKLIEATTRISTLLVGALVVAAWQAACWLMMV
jgi:hypothetical protein